MDLTLIILDLAGEDFVGLWELDWRARQLEESEAISIDRGSLRSAVAQLLDGGEILLFHGISFNSDETQIATPAAKRILAEPATWLPPALSAPHFRICATPKGESEYVRRFVRQRP